MFVIILTGYQEEHKGIPNELCAGIMGRFLVGVRIHDNSWVGNINYSSESINQSINQPINKLVYCKLPIPFCFSYGDRCPKSIAGRLFAVVWILTGICMCSIFTAMLTTSLTTISLDTNIPLPQAKVSCELAPDQIIFTHSNYGQIRLRY